MFYVDVIDHSFKFYSIKCNLKLFQAHTHTGTAFIFMQCDNKFLHMQEKQLFFSEIEILTADGGHVHMKLKCESINFKMGSKH